MERLSSRTRFKMTPATLTPCFSHWVRLRLSSSKLEPSPPEATRMTGQLRREATWALLRSTIEPTPVWPVPSTMVRSLFLEMEEKEETILEVRADLLIFPSR